jgi:hypothetical protein
MSSGLAELIQPAKLCNVPATDANEVRVCLVVCDPACAPSRSSALLPHRRYRFGLDEANFNVLRLHLCPEVFDVDDQVCSWARCLVWLRS